MVCVEYSDKVAILKLNRSVTNALNLQLVEELGETLREVRRSSDVHSLVLASSNEKFYSIGLDIPQLFELTSEDF